MQEIERVAARLLVRSPMGRVLLLRVEPSFRPPFWVTPGGGVGEGESIEGAALRELHEEVGRDDLILGPLVWVRDVEFTWEEWQVRQKEHTFLVEAESEFETVVMHPDEEPIVGGRWFDVDELSSLMETFYPEDLAELVTALGSDGD